MTDTDLTLELDFGNDPGSTVDLEAIATHLRAVISPAFTGDLDSQVAALNTIRRVVAEFSPFASEPVDHIEWVPSGQVTANDYNPNAVAPPEMELLRLSIEADGFTQPIVTNQEDAQRVVVDGFHRHR